MKKKFSSGDPEPRKPLKTQLWDFNTSSPQVLNFSPYAPLDEKPSLTLGPLNKDRDVNRLHCQGLQHLQEYKWVYGKNHLQDYIHCIGFVLFVVTCS